MAKEVRSMANGWTAERRARQSELIRNWKPWMKSTGPRTEAGKTMSAMNRREHFLRIEEELAEARAELRQAQAKVTRLMCARKRSIAEWASLADDLLKPGKSS